MGHREEAIALLGAELEPGRIRPPVRHQDDLVAAALRAIEQRAVHLRGRGARRRALDLGAVEHGHAPGGTQRAGEAPGQLGDGNGVVQGEHRDRRRERADGRRLGPARAQMLAEDADHRERELRRRAEEALEHPAIDGDEVAVARGTDRRRPRGRREQGQLPERRSAPELHDVGGVSAVLGDLEAPRADDVHGLSGVSLPEQPLPGGESHATGGG
jgi:hypothetical protein